MLLLGVKIISMKAATNGEMTLHIDDAGIICISNTPFGFLLLAKNMRPRKINRIVIKVGTITYKGKTIECFKIQQEGV